jgi:Chain length determinant protein
MPAQTQTRANSRPPAYVLGSNSSAYRTEPAPSLIVSALGRYKWLVLGLALLLTAGGLAVGYKRKPVWSASASVQVGQVNPNSPGFYGFVQSATALATTYSRAITADGVLSIIHQKIGLSPQQAASRLSATPIPDGAAFSVIATGQRSSSAVNLSNTAASAIVSYEAAHGSSPNPTGASAAALYNQYRAQSAQLAHDKAIVAKLENKLSNNITGTADPTNPSLVNAQAAAAEAQGHANALAAAYTQALESQQPAGTLLSPLTSALSASSDRKHKLELYGFVGLAMGLLIGASAAILLELRRVRRYYAAH